jgi:hypothetical protein
MTCIPPLLVFINESVDAPTLLTIQTQFEITSTITAAQFLENIAADGYAYVDQIYSSGSRLLVLVDLNNLPDGILADFVLLALNGTMEVIRSNYCSNTVVLCGQLEHFLVSLFSPDIQPTCVIPVEPCNDSCDCQPPLDNGGGNAYYGQFKGEPTNNDDFNPWHMDKPNPEPEDA